MSKLPGRKGAGRPTKFRAETIDHLCSALADGMPIKGACVVAGIGVTTLAEWREKFPDLENRLSEAREFARQKALRAIKAAGKRDWRAHVEWLKLAYASDYRGGNTRIDVSASAIVSQVVLPEEERLKLIERRTKLMELERGSQD